jgi:hypothetical protein
VTDRAAIALFTGDRVGLGVALAVTDAITLGEGETVAVGDGEAGALGDGEAVALDEGEAVALDDGDGDGERAAVGDGAGDELFFFFVVDLLRCFAGVGVGRTKIFFSLSINDSSCSCAVRAWLVTAIRMVNTITINERSFIFIRCFF